MLKNSITLKLFDIYGAYASYTAKLASRARGIRFGSIYPGGYSSISFFIPCDISTPLEISEGSKLIAFNWGVEVWHGFITSISFVLSSNGETGLQILGSGGFGYVLGSQRIDKRWADSRIDASVWVEPDTAYSGNDQTLKQIQSVDRLNGSRIRLTPKAVAFSNQWYHRLRYSQPTGQTTKRISLSYDMQESGQVWTLELFNEASAANVWTLSSSGTGTRDDTLATPSQHVFILFRSGAAQTPATDGTIYGQIDSAISGATSLMVYSETGSINAYEVAKDLVGLLSQLSSNTDRISSALNVSVEPFFTEGKEAAASILQRICSFGDASYQPIGYAVWGSQETGDDKPQLVVEAFPSISTYDLLIDAGDPRLSSPVSIVRDVNSVVNYVSVRYLDSLGRPKIVTPDDDSTLRDDTSISLYGRREADSDLSVGTSTQALAIRAGRAYLARNKDPRAYVSGPIVVRESMRSADGGETPVSEIKAGQRVKLVNISEDVFRQTDAGATFVITETEYDDDTQSAIISCGVPDDLSSFIAALSLVPVKNTGG